MSRWTHVVEADHDPDPHYNGNGLPDWWTCHVMVGKTRCDGALRLDGAKVPITMPIKRAAAQPEPPLSSQP